MTQNLNQNFEQNKNTKKEKVKKSCKFQNSLNGPSQKLPQNKFQIFKNSNQNFDKLNLLYFEINNIKAKDYFAEKRNEEQQKKITQNNQNENLEQKNQKQNNKNNVDDLDDSRNSSFSSDFSYFEGDEKKNEREEIIKKLTKKTDDITFIDFDIFDYSKMMDEDLDFNFFNEKNKDKNESIDNSNLLSTHTTDIKNSQIHLIKKAKNSGLESNEKRKNKYYRNIKKEIIDKSKSLKRNKERSRSRHD